ncbi:MAG TPA: hypothetical protein VFG30_26230 [Polyangiales bacterium]|nr:hypothetical protein [Polyangiales bacterium]
MVCPKTRYPSLLATLVLASCAAQATTDYQGDPLFSMKGRVELPLTAADAQLTPAVAFGTGTFDEIRFMPTEVVGEFPANFQVDLYTPPPSAILGSFASEDIPDEPRHAVGYITAVTPDHLTTLYYASVLTGGSDETCDDAGCTFSMDAQDFSATHKGTVTMFCPHGVSYFPDSVFAPKCTLKSRSGDPMFVSILDDPMFAGAANNYAIGYLESAAKPNGYVANRFGAPEGLAAGYHLLRLLPWDLDGEDERQACRDSALTQAVENYNAANGTHVGSADIGYSNCNEPGCVMFGEHTRQLRGEWYRLMAEHKCLFGPGFERETNPNATVSLRIQPGLNFVAAAITPPI